MKTSIYGLLLLAFVTTVPVLADDGPPKLVDCGSDKVALFEDSTSDDGSLAVGWTILRHDPKSKAVDWTQLKGSGAGDFVEQYVSLDQVSADDEYVLMDCLVDLKAKTFVKLPSDYADYSGRNHASIDAFFGPKEKGTQYVLVEISSRYSAENLWLVRLDSTGMHPTELTDAVTKAIAPVLQEKMPLRAQDYGTSFELKDSGGGDKTPTVIHGSTVTMAFNSDINKPLEDYSLVEGVVTLHLPEGTVTKVTSATPRDDPFQDIPALAKADHALNQVYAQLQKKLSPADRDALKKEQLDWINKRDTDARQAAEDDTSGDTRKSRNKSFQTSTDDRTAELKARLSQLK